MKMTHPEIRSLIRNPHTGVPISHSLFERTFKAELREGYANLKGKIATQYAKDLENGKEYAVRLGLRNRFSWVNEGQNTPPHLLIAAATDVEDIQIRFVNGPGNRKPIDVTPSTPPSSPYAGQAPDYGKPAIEAPRQRESTPFGIHEAPRHEQRGTPSYESQTGEPRPSIFDRNSKDGWMK
jgi:hypothetical protein